ncbi:MAG: class I SAM-dependent methyltransferase [Sedimentisphaerales bacterium]|nr:class I SAM-dependent methyltransferase [Sedimentisphaerales bacterium]
MANERPLIVQELMRLRDCAAPALDVGTGTGLYLLELLRMGIECAGVDVSQAMLVEAKKKLPISVRLVCASVEKLPFPDKEFNLVTACRVFSHVANLNIAIKELSRVTNIDGNLIFSDVSASHNYTTTRIPTPDGDIHIETYKHTIDQFVAAAEHSGCWKVDHFKSISYKDLLWKPQLSEYSAIDASSERPIFFYGVLTRLK